tara:strand:- start:2289 stop:3068 length:780 start_codon:yes stop_codon:yes gene_type:complete
LILEISPIQAIVGLVFTFFAIIIAMPSHVIVGNLKLKNKLSGVLVSYYRSSAYSLRADKILNLTFHFQCFWGLLLIGSSLYRDTDTALLIGTMLISILPIIKKILDQQEYILESEIEDKVLIASGMMINIALLVSSVNYFNILVSLIINLYCLSLINAELKTMKWQLSDITNILGKLGFSICLYSQIFLITKSEMFNLKGLEDIIVGTLAFIGYLFMIELFVTRSIIRRVTESAAHKRLALITVFILAVVAYKIGGQQA